MGLYSDRVQQTSGNNKITNKHCLIRVISLAAINLAKKHTCGKNRHFFEQSEKHLNNIENSFARIQKQ